MGIMSVWSIPIFKGKKIRVSVFPVIDEHFEGMINLNFYENEVLLPSKLEFCYLLTLLFFILFVINRLMINQIFNENWFLMPRKFKYHICFDL